MNIENVLLTAELLAIAPESSYWGIGYTNSLHLQRLVNKGVNISQSLLAFASDPTNAIYEIQEVKVLEESVDITKRTGGNYKGYGLKMDIGADLGDYSMDFSFPYPISLTSTEFTPSNDMIGDCFDVLVAPDTIIGAITSNVSTDDTIINVSPTVVQNLKIGYLLKINGDTVGYVIAINTANNTVTISDPIVNPHIAGTLVSMSVELTKDIWLHGESRVELGANDIGGSYLPANTNIRFTYHNYAPGIAKTFYAILEFRY